MLPPCLTCKVVVSNAGHRGGAFVRGNCELVGLPLEPGSRARGPASAAGASCPDLVLVSGLIHSFNKHLLI